MLLFFPNSFLRSIYLQLKFVFILCLILFIMAEKENISKNKMLFVFKKIPSDVFNIVSS